MHAAGVQFDHAFFVRQAAQTDRVIVGIVLRALHHANAGFERVSTAFKESVGSFDVGIAVVGTYDDRTLGCIALRCVPLLAVLRNSSVCSHACCNSSEH